MKKQVPLAVLLVPAILIVAAVAFFFVVKPKLDEAGRLGEQITELEDKVNAAQLAKRQAENAEATIRVADLFRLTKAMPDEDDMAGIILELNSVASAAGVDFVSISPAPPAPKSGYTALPINLTFEGNYYDLTDFLFRLRNLVIVRDGRLEAEGRLYSLDTLGLKEGPTGFPQISAALTISAYTYEEAAPTTGVPVTPSTTTPAATTTPTDGAALGGTP